MHLTRFADERRRRRRRRGGRTSESEIEIEHSIADRYFLLFYFLIPLLEVEQRTTFRPPVRPQFCISTRITLRSIASHSLRRIRVAEW